MLVTVKSPRDGDPIFTLQTTYNNFEAGAIFVRRNAMTERATPREVARLAERASARGGRLDLGVTWETEPELHAVTYDQAALEAYVAHETERLERFDLRPRGMFAASFPMNEIRSAETYDADVAWYLQGLSDRISCHAAQLATDRGLAELSLALVNQTDLNFPSTLVTLRLPATLNAFFDTDDLDDVLEDTKPPTAWGRGRLGLMLPRHPPILPVAVADARQVRREEDAVVVTLPAVDVRPQTRHPLTPVYLTLPADFAGTMLDIGWRATSTGVDGDIAGTLQASVEVEATDLSQTLFGVEGE